MQWRCTPRDLLRHRVQIQDLQVAFLHYATLSGSLTFGVIWMSLAPVSSYVIPTRNPNPFVGRRNCMETVSEGHKNVLTR
jgi:hypothetical protein